MTVTRTGSDGVQRFGIGGSDAAAAIGVHPYKPPIELWLELTGRSQGRPETPAMYWGRKLEPAVRQEYCNRHQCSIRVPDEPYYHPEKTWARGTPDGIVVDGDRGYEGKCAGEYSAHRWGAEGTDEVPLEYVCQSLWYEWLTDLPRWDIAVLVGGNDYREFTIHRNEDALASLIEGAERFWIDHVLTGIPPEPDGSDEYRKFLVSKYPSSTGERRKATADEMELVDRFRLATIASCNANAQKKLLSAALLSAIGEDRGLDAGDLGRITRVIATRNGNPSVSLRRPKEWTE